MCLPFSVPTEHRFEIGLWYRACGTCGYWDVHSAHAMEGRSTQGRVSCCSDVPCAAGWGRWCSEHREGCVVPRWCLQERGIPWSPGPCAPLVPKEGHEERGEAQASLSRCCSLFVPLTLAAVAGERGGPGSHADGSLGLVHSSGTVRGSRGGCVRAPRSLDGLQPVIHPSHLTLDWAAAPSGSHPLVPPLAHCFFLFHPPTPFLTQCFQPLLSPQEEHGRIQLAQHRDEAAPGQGRGLTADPGMGKGHGAGLLAGDNALNLWKATQATMRVDRASPGPG